MASTTTTTDLTTDHATKVSHISSQIQSYHAQGIKYRIRHGSSNSTRTAGKGTHFLDLSALNRVLSVDAASRTALVEPNVPMDRLVEATLPLGLVPPVVMEFPGITTGGGYAGTSGESSSFRHGWFDRTIEWVEMVLADGRVVRAGPEGEFKDLFEGGAGAVGTLGTTTLVKVRLERARRFVEVRYWPVKGMGEAVSRMRGLMKGEEGEVQYVDGIMFGKESGAVVTGRLVDEVVEGSRVQRFSGRSDPWFYLHVKEQIEKRPEGVTVETVPLAEYLFRYDRGGFWVAPMAFDYFRFPFNRFTRWFLDDFLHTRMMYTALNGGGAGKEIIIQDLGLPMDTAAEFTDYTHEKFGIYPLWLCPLKTGKGPAFHPHLKGRREGQDDGLMMNVGLWGWGPKAPKGADQKQHYLELNRDLERKLTELGGMKWLYAKTFFPEEEFWRDHVGGKEWYDKLRKKYGAEGLPSAFDKTHTNLEAEWNKRSAWKEWLLSVWPLGGVWGLWKAIRSGTYKEARASAWKTYGLESSTQESKKNV
ncbi:FAD-binding domain-containing protein 15 [Elsinoe australis]|uniref:Delta(24)-sterol reductase n=1 Tax=Elsinoe australis TaxID=40998 RepID=A0A4U7B0V8_9PEZI|nr:FAD-binding domain-containing protein 15 [Elsinoe australis]